MIYPLSERAPGASNLTAKNRVWGFFENSNRTRPANRRKPSELRRKIRPTPTKTASGIPYWPSRDPIQELGGMNLYGFVRNDGVNWVDILGLEKSGLFETQEAAIHDGGINDAQKSDNDLQSRQNHYDRLTRAQQVNETRPVWAIEFCGRVCKTCIIDESGSRTDKFYWTGFNQGTSSGCNPATAQTKCDDGDEYTANHHNHPRSAHGLPGGLSKKDELNARLGRNWEGLQPVLVIPAGLQIGATYQNANGGYTTGFAVPYSPNITTPAP